MGGRAMAEGNYLYLKLYNQMKKDIENGTYLPGEKLPAEGDLCKRFGISAITVKKAFGMLVEEGFVRRVPGRGTFVSEVRKEQPVPQRTAPARNTHLIGMILEHVASPFGLDMLYAIDRLLTERGYRLCVRYSYMDRGRETEEINFLLSLGVSGLIIMPCHGDHYSTAILRLIVDEFPVVLIDKQLEGIPVSTVRTDNIGAIVSLVDHLRERGCRNIGLLSMEALGTSSLMERIEGFHQGLEKYGLTAGASCFIRSEYKVDGTGPTVEAVGQVREFLRGGGRALDGLICTEYSMVPMLTRAAAAEGVTLGADGLRVCCVDEDYEAPEGYRFTHVRQDEQAIARKAVEILEDRLQHGTSSIENCLIPGIFRQGGTT